LNSNDDGMIANRTEIVTTPLASMLSNIGQVPSNKLIATAEVGWDWKERQ
jgi:hypothetical protein